MSIYKKYFVVSLILGCQLFVLGIMSVVTHGGLQRVAIVCLFFLFVFQLILCARWIFSRKQFSWRQSHELLRLIEQKQYQQVSEQLKKINYREDPFWNSVYHLLNQLKEVANQRLHLTDQIRQQHYLDAITGLSNRRFFDLCFAELTSDSDNAMPGFIFLLQINDYDHYVETLSLNEMEKILTTIADVLSSCLRTYEQAVIARRGDADFAILLPQVNEKTIVNLARKLLRSIEHSLKPFNVVADFFVHIGIASYEVQSNLSQVLSEADMALKTAKLQGANTWYQYSADSLYKNRIMGSLQWRTLLQNVIHNGNVFIFAQPVQHIHSQEVLFVESLGRIKDGSSQFMKAGIFLPMVQHCGLAARFDQLIIEKITQIVQQQLLSVTVSINIFYDTLAQDEYFEWLITYIKMHDLASQLIIEVTEYVFKKNSSLVISRLLQLRNIGVGICVDRVGQTMVESGYLSQLKPDFIKMNQTLINEIVHNEQTKVLVRSIVSIAQNLNIEMIAEGIEHQSTYQTLNELGIVYVQGYSVIEPYRLI